jgi:[ribosomal protein S5]-alanine N-acetyltransferase
MLLSYRVEMPDTYWLRTPRLGFGRWTADDLHLAREIYGNDELTALIGGPFSDAQVRERLARQLANGVSHNVQHWPVYLLETGENIGCCGFKPYPAEEGVLELGFIFRKSFWSQGFAPEAGRAAIDHALTALAPTAICAGHHPENLRSGRVLTKLGFEYRRHELFEPTGLEHPMYYLAAVSLP